MDNRNFSETLKYLISLTDSKIADIADELGYDNSYISKWINDKNIPAQGISAEVIDQLGEFFTRAIVQKDLEKGLEGLTERKVPVYGDGNKRQILVSCLEDSYFWSLKERNKTVSIDSEKETDSYTTKEEICRVSMQLIKNYVALVREKLVIYTNLDLFDEKNQNLASFSLFITKGIELKFKWLRDFFSKEMNAEAIYQIYDLATRSMYVNSEIFYTEEENFPPFIYIKGKVALSFSTNDQGEVLMMTHSRNSSVLKQYDLICDNLFRREMLVEKTDDSSIFELEMISEALFENNRIYIHDSFIQGYFLPDHILEKMKDRYNLTERDMFLIRRLSGAYKRMLSTMSVRIMIFRQALSKYIFDRKVCIGKYSFELTDEEWDEMLDEMERINGLNDDLKYAFIIDELFPYDLDLWECSMVVDSNNIWYKKNPIYVDRYVDTYVHVISREFNRKIYENIEESFNQTYLKWFSQKEFVELLRREELDNTIRYEF